jgi:hypothetical protein
MPDQLGRFVVDVVQDQTLRQRYAFTVYGLEPDGRQTLVKRSGPRYMTPGGALRRGRRWTMKKINKGKLS